MKQFAFIALFFSVMMVYCQPENIPLLGFSYWEIDKNIHQKGNNLHTSIRPFNIQDIRKLTSSDTIESFSFIKKTKKDTLNNNKYSISISPNVFITSGFDIQNSKTNLETGIGFCTKVTLGRKFAFQSDYINSNSSYNSFMDSIIKENHIIPGANYAYGTKLGWFYQDLNFYLSYNLSKYFNIQAGKTKNFFGEGYRSLLLSDNGASYPLFKITSTIWKIKYVNLYTFFNDVSESEGNVSKYKGKYSAMHYLSINLTKRINFSFFESIVWQAKDSNGTRGFDVNYLNPVVFYRPTEFSIGSPDNAFMGFNLSYLFAKNQQFYAQFMMDEFNLTHIRQQDGWWANKQAYQIGLKSFDLLRIPGLMFQTEYNYIRPYTYSHMSPTQNYGHYNQALAHPLGANLKESVSFLRYKYKRFYFETQFSYIIMGTDTGNVNYGGNIYKPYTSYVNEYNNFVGQGIKNTIIIGQINLYYSLITSLDWNIFLSFSDLSIENSLKKEKLPFISIGISSYLRKPYFSIF